MITVKRLKEILETLPDDAHCVAYEGEDTGISITKGDQYWWVCARYEETEDKQNDFPHTNKKKGA